MKPIVLLGGGLYHYQVIQSLNEEITKNQSVLMVSENPKVSPLEYVPYQLAKTTNVDVHLDLWTVCQKKSVEYLNDRCLQINREEGVVQLENFGSLPFHHLSLETVCEPSFDLSAYEDPSKIILDHPVSFVSKMRQFFREVHRHCPREVRVIITGLSVLSVELSLVLQGQLEKDCENCDIVILESKSNEELSSNQKKQIKKLKKQGIRVLSGARILSDKPHCLDLEGGQALSYDILIPLNYWVPKDFLGKLLQNESPFIEVEEDLTHSSLANLSVVGRNVFVRTKKKWLHEFNNSEVSQLLLHNIFKMNTKPAAKLKDSRQYLDTLLLSDGWKKFVSAKDSGVLKRWVGEKEKSILDLKNVATFEKAKVDVQNKLQQQADQMSRPWRGRTLSHITENRKYFLTTFHGFNSWGNYSQSTAKICEMALLKSLAKGMKAQHLRFHLTLPSEHNHLSRHIFESTLHTIENFCSSHQLEMDGGDTFDGQSWKLCITIGGEAILQVGEKLNSHDYLLITRPLGYGILWAGRLQEGFDSQWIQETLDYKLLISPEQFKDYTLKHNVSASFVVEEWGFLYHCLRHVPAHQQMILNFREVPRWEGTDQMFKRKMKHPGLDINWNRVSGELAFQRDDVSTTNSVLWDSMSQGALVLGVPSHNWQEALSDLKKMGYKKASLVGCTRPKKSGKRVVLSDWSP